MPPAAEVRDALERVLASETFARSERARDLLRYLVAQDLAGHADLLKGFSIAVDVFGRDHSFDPSTDTVVRVQAGRLRDLLAQFYAREGSDESLRIAIPRGSYAPRYDVAAQGEVRIPQADPGDVPLEKEDAAHETSASDTPGHRTGWRVNWGLAATVAAFVAGVGLTLHQIVVPLADTEEISIGNQPMTQLELADVTGSAPREFLPTVYLDVRTVDEPGGERLAGLLRRGLAGFDTISFVAREPGRDGRGNHGRTDHVLAVQPGSNGEIHVELQNLATGKLLLSETFPEAESSQNALQDAVADLLTTIAPVGGVIYARLAEEGGETVLTRCLILNDRYYRDQNAEAHRAAYDCLQDLTEIEFSFSLVYAELAGLHMQAIVAGYDYPAEQTEAQALGYARMAVQLGPNSPSAHRSMGYVLSRIGNAEESLRWTRKAYELNTFDMGMAASYGYALVFAGDYDEGVPILQRAVTAASAHPTWWDYGLALGHFMRDDPQAAASAVTALAASDRAPYLAMRLAVADALGRPDDVATLRHRITQEHPDFVADIDAYYRHGGYPAATVARLVEALRQAGLAGAI